MSEQETMTMLENIQLIAVELEIRNEAMEQGDLRYRLPDSVFTCLNALIRQLRDVKLSEEAEA